MKMFERVSQPMDNDKYTYEDNEQINYISKTDAQREDV